MQPPWNNLDTIKFNTSLQIDSSCFEISSTNDRIGAIFIFESFGGIIGGNLVPSSGALYCRPSVIIWIDWPSAIRLINAQVKSDDIVLTWGVWFGRSNWFVFLKLSNSFSFKSCKGIIFLLLIRTLANCNATVGRIWYGPEPFRVW